MPKAHVRPPPERAVTFVDDDGRASPSPPRRTAGGRPARPKRDGAGQPSWATAAGWTTPDRAKRLLIPDTDDVKAAPRTSLDDALPSEDLDLFPRWPDRPFREYDAAHRAVRADDDGAVHIEPFRPNFDGHLM